MKFEFINDGTATTYDREELEHLIALNGEAREALRAIKNGWSEDADGIDRTARNMACIEDCLQEAKNLLFLARGYLDCAANGDFSPSFYIKFTMTDRYGHSRSRFITNGEDPEQEGAPDLGNGFELEPAQFDTRADAERAAAVIMGRFDPEVHPGRTAEIEVLASHRRPDNKTLCRRAVCRPPFGAEYDE